MDPNQYNSLFAALSAVPDYRAARGRRFQWSFLLVVIAAALLSGQKCPSAIAHWAKLHAAELSANCPQPPATMPSLSTISRTLAKLDVGALEHCLAQLAQQLTAPANANNQQQLALAALAIDGKVLRGAKAHGAQHLLVSVVDQQQGLVLDQVAAAHKQMEGSVVPALLARQSLQGKLITSDALHTQVALAQQILAQGGHYLMIVKANQPELCSAIKLLFESKIWGANPAYGEYEEYEQTNKGHGRIERRQLESSTLLNEYVRWPQVGQVLRRTCERLELKSNKRSVETHFGITDLRPEECSVKELAGYWRGHWTIENKVHYVRDETLGEDRGQSWAGNRVQALAALRNALLNLLRWRGWTNIAAALREHAASVPKAVQFIMAPL